MTGNVAEVLGLIDRHGDNKEYLFTGSRVICDPIPGMSDFDIVCLYNGALSAAFQSHGYNITPHDEYPNENISACYRQDDINIIAVGDMPTFLLWKKATQLAKAMNLRDKFQRVLLFQFITEGATRELGIKY